MSSAKKTRRPEFDRHIDILQLRIPLKIVCLIRQLFTGTLSSVLKEGIV